MDSIQKIASISSLLLPAAAVIWLVVAFLKDERGIEGHRVTRLSLWVGVIYGLVFLREAAVFLIPPVPLPFGGLIVSLLGGAILGGLAGLMASGVQKQKNETLQTYADKNAEARVKAGLAPDPSGMAEAAQIIKEAAQAAQSAGVTTQAAAAATVSQLAPQTVSVPPAQDAPASAPGDDPDSFITAPRPLLGRHGPLPLFSAPPSDQEATPPGEIVETRVTYQGRPVTTRTPVEIDP